MKILVIHGPNLNLLGHREPEHYGTQTLGEINELIRKEGQRRGVRVDFFQSNHEGEIIDKLHVAAKSYDGVIINPGAFTHYSYAIRDAVAAVSIPVVEVHLSNIFSREEFRHHSVISPAVRGQICGFGAYGYVMALHAVIHILEGENNLNGVT